MGCERRVFVARHGESTWNAEHRWAGDADPPLTDLGRSQAGDVCAAIRASGFDAVCSSTLMRAAETAAIIATELSLPQIDPIPQLDERGAGEIRGLTSSRIEASWPGLLDQWRSGEPIDIPGGEPWQAFVDRVRDGLRQLEQVPGRLFVVSHLGVLRAIEQSTGEVPCRYANLDGLWVAA